jgi:hypothetical protein
MLMKILPTIITAAAISLLAGCATQRQVSNMEGHGDRRVYNAAYDQVWRAAIDAAQLSDLEILEANRSTGYIAARRTVRVHTFGENVGMWVRGVDPARTEVEVVSRQAGPPVAWLKNWQNEVHRAIAANLTREAPAVGTAPANTFNERSYVQPEVPHAVREQQRRLDALHEERDARARELLRESDPARRDALERQIDRLTNDIGMEELRLRDLRYTR